MSHSVAALLSGPLADVFEVVDGPRANRQLALVSMRPALHDRSDDRPACPRRPVAARRPPSDVYEELAQRRRRAQIRARHQFDE